MTTAVTDRLQITPEEAKAYFRLNGVEEPMNDIAVQLCVNGAKSDADGHLKNDFEDKQGNDLPIPPAIKLWVLKRAYYHYTQRVGGVESESVSGIGSVTYNTKEFFAELNQWRDRRVKFV